MGLGCGWGPGGDPNFQLSSEPQNCNFQVERAVWWLKSWSTRFRDCYTGASYLKFKWTELQISLVGKELISNPSNIAIFIPSQCQLPAPMPPLVRELVTSSWTMCTVVAQKPNLWTAIVLELAVITVTTLKMLESSVRVSTKITVFKYSDLLLTYYVLNQYTLQQQQMNLF